MWFYQVERYSIFKSREHLRDISLNTIVSNKPIPAIEELMCNQQSLWKSNNELFREFLEYKKSKGT